MNKVIKFISITDALSHAWTTMRAAELQNWIKTKYSKFIHQMSQNLINKEKV